MGPGTWPKPQPIATAPEALRKPLLVFSPDSGWQTARRFDGKWVDSATLMQEFWPTHWVAGAPETPSADQPPMAGACPPG